MTTIKTSNKLTVKFLPWFIWAMAGFFTVVILPMLMTTFLQSIPKKLTCKREKSTQINCQLQNSILSSTAVAVEGLQGARFQTKAYNHNKNQNQSRNRIPYEIQKIFLLTKKGEVVFLSHQAYSPEYTTQKMLSWESQINAFVSNPNQQYLKLQTANTEPTWFVMTPSRWIIIGAIFNGILVITIMGEVSICEFDLSSGYMTRKRRWLFLFTKKTKHSLQEIKDVQVEWEKHKTNVYRITLTLASGKQLPLSTYYANYLKPAEKIKTTTDEIRNFLSLPSH
ncbi:hypothetical protein Riv7116_0868 [Rivularia sp. PCC 7116]|uniref:hypothetical protein n=1 Tax=Rivularia sp. PCC 7116 TaxID=373994 RepID=UPI00029F40DE|nr:hypothetical protein [Rivularia sp. PCC 7116]AFY53449.1 hypothetical protein Riv7116_0868 [Rivularia sp. PCC 7116]